MAGQGVAHDRPASLSGLYLLDRKPGVFMSSTSSMAGLGYKAYSTGSWERSFVASY